MRTVCDNPRCQNQGKIANRLNGAPCGSCGETVRQLDPTPVRTSRRDRRSAFVKHIVIGAVIEIPS